MGEDNNAENIRLESWMSDLPTQIKDLPFIYLAIPGSHDSMTFGITRASGLAPDAEPILHRLYPLFRSAILRWTKTQFTDTWQQLLLGIRYLDLRIATKEGDDKFYFTHGLYAEEISLGMHEVKKFVETHPGEVVILDFQHFYGMTKEDHVRLTRYLVGLFGSKLIPRRIDLQALTLNSLNRLKMQVIIVYRNESASATGEFWQQQMMPSPWPQKDTIYSLYSFLQNVRRPPNVGFVHQAVLTPTPFFIALRFTSNLRDRCAVPVQTEILPKLAEYTPGPPSPDIFPSPVNVVIADFIEMDDAKFPKTIIGLNKKLLNSDGTVRHNYG